MAGRQALLPSEATGYPVSLRQGASGCIFAQNAGENLHRQVCPLDFAPASEFSQFTLLLLGLISQIDSHYTHFSVF
jgi:hypothetical protein